ncbi:MAG: DUF5615 family PIN-like protein [Candidatus Thorarchaeota archaeon]
MPWEPIPIDKKDFKFIERKFGKKARFLIDENLDGELTKFLRDLGWNVKGVKEEGLGGCDDMTILSFAWKEKRIIITNDEKFPGGKFFQEQGNPGIIVIPDGSLDSKKLHVPLYNALQIVGSLALAYRKSKSKFSQDGIIEVTNRSIDNGRIETTKYRLDNSGGVSKWVG